MQGDNWSFRLEDQVSSS